jgi:hypothetical protein
MSSNPDFYNLLRKNLYSMITFKISKYSLTALTIRRLRTCKYCWYNSVHKTHFINNKCHNTKTSLELLELSYLIQGYYK